jgi:hypothetical protein
MLTILPVLTFFIILGALASAVVGTARSKALATFRAEAMEEFDGWLAGDAARQLDLGPGHCEIVKREETTDGKGGGITFYALTLFLRTGAGRYVMYKSTPTGPYAKLVEPSVAKVVLKDRYVPR